MRKKHLTIALLTAAPALLFAYSSGPDAGNTGAPGESDCSSCHGGPRAPTATAGVTIAFPPGLNYAPGATQHLVVTIADPAQKRWGFQLTARQDTEIITQAGTFTPGTDGNTQLACRGPIFTAAGPLCVSQAARYPLQYIEQTQPGTRNGTVGSITFQFDWTPPATNVGNIVIYVAANAANGDGSSGGDHIYLNTYTLTPAQIAPPGISNIVSGASFQPGVSPASWVTVTGANLSTTTRTWTAAEVATGALPTKLDGVSVTINNKPAYIYYISPAQVNLQAPSDTAAGPVLVQLTNAAGTTTATAQLNFTQPAFFLAIPNHPVATHTDYSYADTVKPGETIILWGTGFGPTTPVTPAGQTVTTAATVANVTVTIGGQSAQVYGTALSPGSAGLYQVAVQIPLGLAAGDQPVIAQIASAQSPAGVVLTVVR